MSDDEPPKLGGIDFCEDFLRANANPEYIGTRFAAVLRSLMRGVGSLDPSGPVSNAAQEMRVVVELIERCPEPISFHRIFSEAVSDVRENLWTLGESDQRMVHAALDGLMYLTECSCHDNAARGRASKRCGEFRRSAQDALKPQRR